MPEHAVWALIVKKPDGTLWRCPRCGEHFPYGAKRSLWSLLPFVCVHEVVDWTPRIEDERQRNPHLDGYARIIVKRSRPIGMPGDRKVGRVRMFFGRRLRQEVQGKRNHWWGPLTAEGRDERDERKRWKREVRAIKIR